MRCNFYYSNNRMCDDDRAFSLFLYYVLGSTANVFILYKTFRSSAQYVYNCTSILLTYRLFYGLSS